MYLGYPEVAADTQVAHIRTLEEMGNHSLEEGALHIPEEDRRNLAGNLAGHHIARVEDSAGTCVTCKSVIFTMKERKWDVLRRIWRLVVVARRGRSRWRWSVLLRGR
jgi:hypothetical protein